MVEVKHNKRLREYDTFVLAHQVEQVWSHFWVSFLAILFQSFILDAPDFANA
jgi:hypothetical protein